MRLSEFHRVTAALGVVLMLFALLPSSGGAQPLDFPLPDGSGHFYKQANGQGGRGETGYAIANADDIPFWDEYRRLGGPNVLGYPVSRRFVWDGFVVQAMQKVVFQWRPESKTVAFVNVLDRMHDLGRDGWLQAFRQTPPPFDTAPDTGLTWEEVKRRHWAFLDASPAIKARYWADSAPLDHFGLPMSYADVGNAFVVRAQRAAFQYWKEDVPWARKGEVTIANAGDLAKEAGLFPALAVTPQLPSDSSRPVPPPCPQAPVRGFGVVWAEQPEAYELLGCLGWPPQEQGSDVAVQRFERGWMLWVRSPAPPPFRGPAVDASPQIYVLFEDDQSYATFSDTWTEAEAVSGGLTPPEGKLEPRRGLGKVWREGTGVRTRERLGWATEPERSGHGAWQAFQRGRMVWTPDPRLVFVLAERTPDYRALNTWRVFPDKYQG